MSNDFEPVVKWSGSKHRVAPLLARLLPPSERYFEPFVGGGAMLPYRAARLAMAGDIVVELIHLWQEVQTNPEAVGDGYEARWQRLQAEGHTAYYEIRDRFNRTRDPLDLLFLTRTCVNGLIRFNQQGEFNNSLHHTRPGISPDRLRRILSRWHPILAGITFRVADYRETLQEVKQGDVVFLDPPYACNRGRYMPGTFDIEEFYRELDRLNRCGVNWLLTLDGQAGERRYQADIPADLYTHRLSMATGNSPFTRLMGTTLDAVRESVYLNFDPPRETLAQFAHLAEQPPGSRRGQQVDQGSLFGDDEL